MTSQSVHLECSANIPTLYFLDICTVAATKLSATQLASDPRKAALVAKLKSLDCPENIFSCISALIEKISDSRNEVSDEILKSQILDDLVALRKFFKKSKVFETNEFVIHALMKLRGEVIELKKPNYLRFLEAANNRFELRNTVSPELKLAKAKEILKEADVLEVNRQHPIVILILACLYENSSARNLMKFKENPRKFNAENSLSDVMTIQRLAEIRQVLVKCIDKNIRTDFITDDDGLEGVIRYFELNVVNHEENSEVSESQFKGNVELEKLLVKIDSDEYNEIYNLLFCTAP